MYVLLQHTEKLWVFLKVIEKGSLSCAAKELGLTQPTVSYAIKTLEDLLGTKLITRSAQGVTLSSAGKLLHEEMSFVKDHLIKTETEFYAKDSIRVPKNLSIGTYESIAVYLWPKLTHYIENEYPETQLSLVTKRSSEVIQDAADGKIDVGLVVGPVHDKTINCLPLYRDTYSFYSHSRKVSSDSPIITVPDAFDSKGRSLHEWIGLSDFSGRNIFSLSSFEVCAEFASKGLGITVLPTRVHRSHALRGKKLLAVKKTGITPSFGEHDFYFCYRSVSSRSDLFNKKLAELIVELSNT